MHNEFKRIVEIKRRLTEAYDAVLVGIGDDAAVLSSNHANQVLSVDTQVENVHFNRSFTSFPDIGYRSIVAALSDLAAMGAIPQAALVAMVIPPETSDDQLYALADGISEAANHYKTAVVGGNLSSGTELSISTTVVGYSDGGVLTRKGAQEGDQIYVTGTIGGAALGLRSLQLGQPLYATQFIKRWLRPVARISEGQNLVGVAHAAIDISDGLIQDLGHLCHASQVSAEVNTNLLPLEVGYIKEAERLDCDPIALALSGGEDYELLFTAASRTPIDGLGTCIGRIVEGNHSVRIVDEMGHSVRLNRSGYQHF